MIFLRPRLVFSDQIRSINIFLTINQKYNNEVMNYSVEMGEDYLSSLHMYIPGGRRAEAASRRPYCYAVVPVTAAAGSVYTSDAASSPASAAAQQTSATTHI